MQAGSPAYDVRLRQWCADLDRLATQVRKPVPTCEGCRRFTRDRSDPPAGMGTCGLGLGMWHPGAPHWCKQREAAAIG